MNFQNLGKIELYTFYLDVAFSSAKAKADSTRAKHFKDKLTKSKVVETERIKAVTRSLIKQLNRILKVFPFIDDLHPFYKELVKCTIDYYATKKSLGALKWVVNKVQVFSQLTISKIQKTRDIKKINEYRREFYGRVSSLFKQIKKDFLILEEARKIMRLYPIIKTSLFTVVITGFPNIGKTTLLYKLTGSKPEINSYAFTTKSINIGYLQENNKKIQILDTPGTLNRFNKMNNIEKQAFLAMKYCAKLIIYVFDLTEPYPLNKQVMLYEKIKKFDLPFIVYVSKTDILDIKKVEEFEKNYNAIKDIEEIKKSIFQFT